MQFLKFRFVIKAGVRFGDGLQSLDSLCACSERYVFFQPLRPYSDNISVCA